MSFDDATLARLRDEREVQIETTSPTGAVHRAVIWVVADEHDAYVRSWLGERGRWYRELRDIPEGALLLGGRRIPIRATAAVDPASTKLVSDLLEAKYDRRSHASTQQMLLPETLPTTLRLEPT